MKKNQNKVSIADKALANAVDKGEININLLSKKRKNKIKKIMKTTSKRDLERSSRLKYRFSKRKIKHLSNNENINQDEFKDIINNIEEWDDPIKGGLAKDKKPGDFNIDKLSKGSEIQMEHTDDPNQAIDIAMDHLTEFDDYYDDDKGLPSMEKELSDNKKILKFDDFKKDNDDDLNNDLDDDDLNDDELDDDDLDDNLDDDDLNDNDLDDKNLDIDNYLNRNKEEDDNYLTYKEIKFKLTPKNNDIDMKENFIRNFSSFRKLNENENERQEPKMYPKENKFKRVIKSSDNIEESLIEHNFKSDDTDGDYIIFDLMNKSYTLTDDLPDDIRPCGNSEFDHIMNNL